MLLRRRSHRKAALAAVLCLALAGSAWTAHDQLLADDDVATASAPAKKPAKPDETIPVIPVPTPLSQAGTVPDPGAEILAHQAEIVGRKQRLRRRSTEFKFAQYNVLGSSHTGPGRERPTWRSGTSRMAASVGVLRDAGHRHRLHAGVPA